MEQRVKLEDKITVSTQAEQLNRKGNQNEKGSLRDLWDNNKHNNIHSTEVPKKRKSK